MKVKKIVFDLDNTLIDHSFSFHKTLLDIFPHGKDDNISFEEFYNQVNLKSEELWCGFEKGEFNLDKALNLRSEFISSLLHSPVDHIHSLYFKLYINNSYSYLGVSSLLGRLKENYSLIMCTNGLEDIQSIKLKRNNLFHYFESIYYGNEHPYTKPNLCIFKKIIRNEGCKPGEILFIGDSIKHDITPAQKMGLKTIHIDNSRLKNGTLQWKKIIQEIECFA